MRLVPPTFGNPPLRWRDLPPQLRLLRLLLAVVWASGIACLATLFCLQFQILTSPKVATRLYMHAVNFKGGTFYLPAPLFTVWTTLSAIVMPLLLVGLLLILGCNNLECRVKRRLWDAALGELVERASNQDTSPG